MDSATPHFFVPESEHCTRTYVLLFGQAKHPIFKLLGNTYLKFSEAVVDQDADILGKLYPDTPQKIKLNKLPLEYVRLAPTTWQRFPLQPGNPFAQP